MPSIKKRVYGIIRQLSTSQVECDAGIISTTTRHEVLVEERPNDIAGCFIKQYLQGKLCLRDSPEIYHDKAGVDLPVLHVEPLLDRVFSAYTGPDGGITQVPPLRGSKRAPTNLANLDDELAISIVEEGGLAAVCCDDDTPLATARRVSLGGGSQRQSPVPHLHGLSMPSSLANSEVDVSAEPFLNWSTPHDRAFGVTTSLYERHPFSKQHAGNPVADVFAVVARENSCILCMADGVNWGEKSRLAARCGVRGTMDYLNDRLFYGDTPVRTTLEIFHYLLQAFHSGHKLIVQEGGSLTTMCVVVVVQLAGRNDFVACACNVGDSLAFVYSDTYGVRELTAGSHDTTQVRDMRDALGALGPVDGVNPELQNLTCSLTFLDPGDIVFLTSDGVSDNFDPVVGKFCLSRGEAKQTLPVVEAQQRHELMLLRMEDLLVHGTGLGPAQSHTSARDLCQSMLNFTQQLTMAKRRILEDPELYIKDKQGNHDEQRRRRKQVKEKIAEMPGKLDHASIVAYTVGLFGSKLPDSDQEDESATDVELAEQEETPKAVRRPLALAQIGNGDVFSEKSSQYFDPLDLTPCVEESSNTAWVPLTPDSPPLPFDPPLSMISEYDSSRLRLIDESSKSSSVASSLAGALAGLTEDGANFDASELVSPSSAWPNGDNTDQIDDEADFDSEFDENYAPPDRNCISDPEDYNVLIVPPVAAEPSLSPVPESTTVDLNRDGSNGDVNSVYESAKDVSSKTEESLKNDDSSKSGGADTSSSIPQSVGSNSSKRGSKSPSPAPMTPVNYDSRLGSSKVFPIEPTPPSPVLHPATSDKRTRANDEDPSQDIQRMDAGSSPQVVPRKSPQAAPRTARPVTIDSGNVSGTKKKHQRSSPIRHTLAVDISILRRLRKGHGAGTPPLDSPGTPTKSPRRLLAFNWSPSKSIKRLKAFATSNKDLRRANNNSSRNSAPPAGNAPARNFISPDDESPNTVLFQQHASSDLVQQGVTARSLESGRVCPYQYPPGVPPLATEELTPEPEASPRTPGHKSLPSASPAPVRHALSPYQGCRNDAPSCSTTHRAYDTLPRKARAAAAAIFHSSSDHEIAGKTQVRFESLV